MLLKLCIVNIHPTFPQRDEYHSQMVQPETNYAGLLKLYLIEDMLKHFDVSRRLMKNLCGRLLVFHDRTKGYGLFLDSVWQPLEVTFPGIFLKMRPGIACSSIHTSFLVQ